MGLGGTVAASFASPYGVAGAMLPWKLYARIEPGLSTLYSWNVSENVPTWSLLREAPGDFVLFTALTAIAVGSFVLTRRKTHVPHVILFVAFLYLGLQAKRNMAIYLMVLIPVVAGNVNAAFDSPAGLRFSRRARLLAARAMQVASAAVVLALFVSLRRARAAEPAKAWLSPFRLPVQATELLKAEKRPVFLFNSIRYGGYLTWKLYPRHKVFIDGRLILRTPGQFQEYLNVLDNPSRFEALRQRWHLTHAVLPTAVFTRYLPLARQLYEDPRWHVQFADGSSILFAFAPERAMRSIDLADPSDIGAIAESIGRQWGTQPSVRDAALFHLAHLLIFLGHADRSEDVLRGIPSADAERMRARADYTQGRWRAALSRCRRLISRDPDDAHSLNLAGAIHLGRGSITDALVCYRSVLQANPYDVTARRALHELEVGPFALKK